MYNNTAIKDQRSNVSSIIHVWTPVGYENKYNNTEIKDQRSKIALTVDAAEQSHQLRLLDALEGRRDDATRD